MHHLDLRLLRSFAAVAEERSVTRAAARLNITQPTVSGQIKELELTLGYLLLHRTSRRISLSQQGKRLLPLVQALLQNAEEVRQEAQALQDAGNRQFRLGAAMYTMDLSDRLDLLDAFATANPELSYAIDNRLQSDQVRDLLTDRLDAAIILGIAVDEPVDNFTRDCPPSAIVNEILFPNSLDRVLLRRRKIGLLVPVDSPLAEFDLLPAAALAQQRVAMLSGEHGRAIVDPMVSFFMQHGAVPVAVSEGNALAVERFAQREHCCAIGIGWFPTPEGLAWRAVDGFDLYLDLSIVLGTNPNRAACRFFDFARRWQAERAESATGTGPASCVTVDISSMNRAALH